MVQDSEPLGSVCSKCCRELTPDATVRLWDRKDFCETCVEEACPGLAEYARTREALEEEMPHSAWRIGTIVGLVCMGSAIGFGILLWAIGVGLGADPMDPDSLCVLLLFPVIGLPVSIVFGVAHATGFAMFRPVVSVRDNQLRITMRSETKSIPLSECEWYIGKTWHMTHPRVLSSKTGMLRDTAVVIILPQHAGRLDPRWDVRWDYPRRVATGFTEETRHRWEAFLTLAAVPRRAFGLPRGSSV